MPKQQQAQRNQRTSNQQNATKGKTMPQNQNQRAQQAPRQQNQQPIDQTALAKQIAAEVTANVMRSLARKGVKQPSEEEVKQAAHDQIHDGRGRPEMVDAKTFARECKNADKPEDVVAAFDVLAGMDPDKARQYVISRATYLRSMGWDIPYFQRGRPANRS